MALPLTNCHYCSNDTPQHEEGVFQPTLKASDLSDNRWGFDLVTYYQITQVAKYDLYVMKCSEGGTSIDVHGEAGKFNDHWTADISQLESPGHSLLLQFKRLVQTCLQASQDELDIQAMLWHQGEGDRGTFSPVSPVNYYHNLKAVFQACREFVGKPDLPIICGTISHHSKQYDPTVEAGLLRLAQEDSDLHVIDLQHATLRDDFHFDAQSSQYFGQAIYNELITQKIIMGPRIDIQTHVF